MSLAKVSLAKALKLKNRLTGRLAEVTAEIQGNNSVLAEQVGSESVPDVRALLESRRQLVTALVDLKAAHYLANQPIQRQLYVLGEKKAEVAFLRGIHVRDGVERHSYQNTELKWIAEIKKSEIDTNVRKLESEIDALQEEIDQYNYTAKVEVPQLVLDLGS